ncbi:hypothetical protein [Agriterribacter sp.]|uniref:hypothetical protein n=1 Tax=Agriterribacter sp. TaxID=2821509 RepID=UPI002BA4A6EA|nr:hypothetical protein [Agriterribacter sp.]HRO45774.1 hypothetical protein [Agriterribacter sp.]HRQ16771.1 hypothetical protein [Agriterribacter sp.]
MRSQFIILNLHLQYRLWIAELNFLVDEIRILKDYFQELVSYLEKDPLLTINASLTNLREDIDALRNEMHLDKMELASRLKHNTVDQPWNNQRTESFREQHDNIKKTFTGIRQRIESLTTQPI